MNSEVVSFMISLDIPRKYRGESCAYCYVEKHMESMSLPPKLFFFKSFGDKDFKRFKARLEDTNFKTTATEFWSLKM